jgi:hypothetical protein
MDFSGAIPAMIWCCFGVDEVVLKGTQQNCQFGIVATIIGMHFSE